MEQAAYNGRARDPHRGDGANDASVLRAAPAVVRIVGGVGVRTAEWTLNTYVRTLTRLARAAVDGQSAAELLQDTGNEVREQVRKLLGIEDPVDPLTRVPDDEELDGVDPRMPLRKRGAELLNRSADVDFEEEMHPAYARILTQLTPDEARILRLLSTEGAQAAIDVRTWRPFGMGDELVAPGLSMLGAEAGCRHDDRVPSYLNNLYRLGLIWFSREPIDDLSRYQVLEAQPDAAEAMDKAGRPRTIRRSIRLTPFGGDFCKSCIPADTGEFEAIKRESAAAADGAPAAESPSPRARV